MGAITQGLRLFYPINSTQRTTNWSREQDCSH